MSVGQCPVSVISVSWRPTSESFSLCSNCQIYSHRADESPPLSTFSSTFSPTVFAIQAHVQHVLLRPVNHVHLALLCVLPSPLRGHHLRPQTCLLKTTNPTPIARPIQIHLFSFSQVCLSAATEIAYDVSHIEQLPKGRMESPRRSLKCATLSILSS